MTHLPVLTAVAVLTSLAACHEQHGHEKRAPVLPVTTPMRQNVEINHEYVARIHAFQHIELRAQERGYLTGIHVDEGQLIQAGARMFQIQPLLYDAELLRAKAEQDMADIEFRNTALLAKNNIVAAPELAMARARLEKAAAERSLADAHRKLTEVRAPFTGLMGRFEVRLGSLVEEGELLTTLSDNSTIWAYFNLSEAEYLDYQMRDASSEPLMAQLRLANGKVFEHLGKVETIVADFDAETGTIAFRATFPNPTGILRHGETGNVILKRELPDALVIPQAATFEILDQRFVFVVDDAGTVSQRQISVSAEMPHLFAVVAGLAGTDKILLDGLRKVQHGAKIEIELLDPARVLASLEPPAE